MIYFVAFLLNMTGKCTYMVTRSRFHLFIVAGER